MVTPQGFELNVPDSVLDDLRMRLERARWPDEAPDGATWQYGTDLHYLQDLVDYWRHGFDWRAQEARLNTFKQYTASMAGIDLHFIHEPGIGPRPYARQHEGWPLPGERRVEVPTAYISFPHDILHPPRALAERAFNIQRWTIAPRGGHFAALEEPELLALDIRAFFRPLRA